MTESGWAEIIAQARKPSNEVYLRSSVDGINVQFTGAVVKRKSPNGFDQFVADASVLDREKGLWLPKKVVLNGFQLADLLEALEGPPVFGTTYLLKMTGEGTARKMQVHRVSP